MGLEPASHRDIMAFAVMQQHAAAEAARRIAAMEGAVRDTKRVKLSDFSRGPPRHPIQRERKGSTTRSRES
jgi:hypothetical protein